MSDDYPDTVIVCDGTEHPVEDVEAIQDAPPGYGEAEREAELAAGVEHPPRGEYEDD